VDGLLAVLRADVDAGVVSMDLAVPIAEQLCSLRAEAIWALGAAPRGSQGTFLSRTAPAAMLGDWQYGVPTSVTLAQAVLESDWGRSAPGHNLFGLKGEGPAGSSVRQVVEYRHGRRGVRRDAFRAYNSESEALKDHARILGTRARYARARAAGEDRQAFARALVGVYATDPRYAGKLDRIIGLFDLDRFDWATPRSFTVPAPVADLPQVVDLGLPWQLPAAWGVGQ
jgi:flagellum-specific peptidoglycan hydrolase FlgJ